MSLRSVLLSTILFAVASSAAGEIFQRDFFPGSDDGLLTYDDVNQREWLDVTVFAGEWLGGAWSAARSDPDFDFGHAFPQLGPGGIFEDFRVVAIADLMALAVSAGIDTSVFDSINNVAAGELVRLLGRTYGSWNPPDGRGPSIGFVDDFIDIGSSIPGQSRGIARITHDPGHPSGVSVGLISNAHRPAYVGLMLFREAIPEPSSGVRIMLFGTVVSAPVRRRRYRSS